MGQAGQREARWLAKRARQGPRGPARRAGQAGLSGTRSVAQAVAACNCCAARPTDSPPRRRVRRALPRCRREQAEQPPDAPGSRTRHCRLLHGAVARRVQQTLHPSPRAVGFRIALEAQLGAHLVCRSKRRTRSPHLAAAGASGSALTTRVLKRQPCGVLTSASVYFMWLAATGGRTPTSISSR